MYDTASDLHGYTGSDPGYPDQLRPETAYEAYEPSPAGAAAPAALPDAGDPRVPWVSGEDDAASKNTSEEELEAGAGTRPLFGST